MSISLTREELCEHLKYPTCIELLILAVNEDVKSIFPLRYQVNTQ